MGYHKSTAYLPLKLTYRDKVSNQFRWVIRACVAANDARLPYDVQWWQLLDKRAAVTFEAKLPPTFRVKALPKIAETRKVPNWKPRMFEAEYRLNAYLNRAGKFLPGFVVEHSCGLSLVLPSHDGEWPDTDARKGWRLTHTVSGKGFGIEFNFERGVRALLMIAAVDWTKSIEQLATILAARRGSALVRATFGKSWDKEQAKRELADLERAQAEQGATEVAA